MPVLNAKHHRSDIAQENITEQQQLRESMVARHGPNMPVVEYIDRDIAHMQAQHNALTVGLSATKDVRELVERETTLTSQMSQLQQQADTLRENAPPVPPDMFGTFKALPLSLVSR